MTMTGYHPERLAALRVKTVRAIESLRDVRSDDPAAHRAVAAAAAACATLEHQWLGQIDEITRTDPMGSWTASRPEIAPSRLASLAGGQPVRRHRRLWAVPDRGGRRHGIRLGNGRAACRDGGDDCPAAVAELVYDVAAGRVLTPPVAELTKYLLWALAKAIAGAMEQSPYVVPDWTHMNVSPGDEPYESDGGPVPEQHVPNGSNETGQLSYGDGPDCAGLDFYGTEHPEC